MKKYYKHVITQVYQYNKGDRKIIINLDELTLARKFCGSEIIKLLPVSEMESHKINELRLYSVLLNKLNWMAERIKSQLNT